MQHIVWELLAGIGWPQTSLCASHCRSLIGNFGPFAVLQALWSLQAVGSFKRTKGGMPVTTAIWSSSSMTTLLAVPQQESQSGSSCRRLCLWQMLCCRRHSGSLLRSCRQPPRWGCLVLSWSTALPCPALPCHSLPCPPLPCPPPSLPAPPVPFTPLQQASLFQINSHRADRIDQR